MKGPGNLVLAVGIGAVLLFFLLPFLMKLVSALVHLTSGLLYLAIVIAAVIFVVGLVRRLMQG